MTTTSAPASASGPRPDLPCKVVVPAKVVLGDDGGTVTGRRAECPALLRSTSWRFAGPKADSGFTLWFDADALYPTREMTQMIYGFEGPGRYRLVPLQTATFWDESVGEYGDSVEVPLTASNDVIVKYAASAAVAVAHKGTGARRTTTVTVRGRRAAAFGNEAAAGQAVDVFRDGRLLRRVTLNVSGVASWTFADRTGAHTYTAAIVETARTWKGTSRPVRG